LADHLVKEFKQQIAELTLMPSDGGRFEVKVDGELVYSKLATGSFPDNGTIASALSQRS